MAILSWQYKNSFEIIKRQIDGEKSIKQIIKRNSSEIDFKNLK